MPSWTRKEERMYEHIRDSNLDRGVKEERAKEIAGRTVNKFRREHGETPNATTQGTGNPNRSLEDRSKDELSNIARDMKIDGRSQMTKQQLVDAIRSKR